MENTTKSPEEKQDSSPDAKPATKEKKERPPSQAKPGRVIIRNIQFDLTDKHLKNKF